MTWAVAGSGSQTATIGTEHTLTTDTTNATYSFQVRCNNMALGDVVELRLYTMTLAAGTLEVVWKTTIGPSLPAAIVATAPPQPSNQSLRATLKQVSGTGRVWDWKLLRM